MDESGFCSEPLLITLRDHKTILRDLTLCGTGIAAVTAIIGPNGSGKSTLLSLLSGLNTPGLGELNILGKPVQNWKRKLLARELAMVPQFSPVPAGMSVVSMSLGAVWTLTPG